MAIRKPSKPKYVPPSQRLAPDPYTNNPLSLAPLNQGLPLQRSLEATKKSDTSKAGITEEELSDEGSVKPGSAIHSKPADSSAWELDEPVESEDIKRVLNKQASVEARR